MKEKPRRCQAKKAFPGRASPVVPPSARKIEKRIVTLLSTLVKRSYPSCLDTGFRSAYEEILRLFTRYQAEVLAAYPLKVTCGGNCGICCNHWPEDTYSFEVRYLADYLQRKRPKDIGRIAKMLAGDIECLDRIKRTVAQRVSDPGERAAMGDIDPYDVALSTFYQMNRHCPLLDKNGSCSVYPVRPLTCRVYVSFSSPALCRPGRILGDRTMTYLLDLEKDASELFDRLHFMYDVFDGDTGLRSMLYRALAQQ